jgi:hypothetical protein
VERAVAAKEVGVSEVAAPELADGRAANEAPRVVRRDAEEDLIDEAVVQIRQRAVAREFQRRRPGHGCCSRGVWVWGLTGRADCLPSRQRPVLQFNLRGKSHNQTYPILSF